MLLALGSHHLDVTHRAVVIGVLPAGDGSPAGTAADLVRNGADVVEIDDIDVLATVVGESDHPVSVHVELATAIAPAVEAGAALVVTPDRAAVAAGAGVPVLVSVDLSGSAGGIGEALRTVEALVADGRVVAASASSPDDCAAEVMAAIGLAIASGARAVRVGDVRTARRVVDVMARILELRSTVVPSHEGGPS